MPELKIEASLFGQKAFEVWLDLSIFWGKNLSNEEMARVIGEQAERGALLWLRKEAEEKANGKSDGAGRNQNSRPRPV